MKQILMSLPVRGKRDLVLVRQRTRQIAALLGYGEHDQVCLAAGVFDLACQVRRRWGRTTWHFLVDNRNLGIFPEEGHARVRIDKPLPEKSTFSGTDIRWMAGELDRLTPLDIFAEIQELNQQLWQALLELRSLRCEQPAGPRLKPAA